MKSEDFDSWTLWSPTAEELPTLSESELTEGVVEFTGEVIWFVDLASDDSDRDDEWRLN